MHEQCLDDKPVGMEKRFKRDISSLEAIFAFVEEFISSNDIEKSVLYPMQLALEELFTNILKYQTDGSSDVGVTLERKHNELIVQVCDYDSEPFDITKANEVDTNKYIEQKKPGGLGIHLVKQIVDSLDYTYDNGTSIITLKKILER